MRLPVMPPVEPMLAKAVGQIPHGWLYEPKWDGFRAIVFRDGPEVEIISRNARPLARYFPEVVTAVRENLPARCVVDGEIIIANPETGELDFWALQQRLHPADSRVRLLAEETPASLIGFDILALADLDLMARPFAQRRETLVQAFAGASPPVHITPITEDEGKAKRWFEVFEGAGLDGVVAKHREHRYQPGRRIMHKVKHDRTADCVVVGYRAHKSGPDVVGSLLLALYADSEAPRYGGEDVFGSLHPIGVVASFTNARRKELAEELKPLVIEMSEHPWGEALSQFASAAGPNPGSRWNPGKDLSFVPLRPERVVEVRYNHMDGGHLRHPAQFIRWRPDRDPASCGFGQLERPAPLPIADILEQGRP